MKVICNKTGSNGECFDCGASKPHDDRSCEPCLLAPDARCVPFNYWIEKISDKGNMYNVFIEYDYLNNWNRVRNMNEYIKSICVLSNKEDKKPFRMCFSDAGETPLIILNNVDDNKLDSKALMFRVIGELIGE